MIALVLAFGLICLAAHRVGRWFSAVNLPYITGYLAVGAAVGTFGLDLVPTAAAEDLRFVDELSLAVIAFVAGSELRVQDLRGRVRAITAVVGSITGVGVVALGAALFAFVAAGAVGGSATTAEAVATAALGATVLLALSPPSTIAVIKDVRAQGPFTSQSLVTTIVMDVVIIVLFAVAGSLAAALLRGGGFDALFAVVLAIDLALAVGGGLVLGRALGALLTHPRPRGVRIVGIVASGYAVFVLASTIATWTARNLPFEIYIEPLLLCLVAGFVVANLTAAGDAFEKVLHDVAPAVYVLFFTLTGLSLQLDVLVAVLPVAAALFLVRLGALFVGSRLGATLAGAPPAFRRRSWMAFVTQAGIALGLARESVVQFPEIGASFSTLIIAVVVLNELLGPLFLARALRSVGEAGGDDATHRAVTVFGIEQGTYRLAERLAAAGWAVRLLDDDAQRVERAVADGHAAARVELRDPDAIGAALSPPLDVLVLMSGDDDANLAICRVATDRIGIDRVVARVTDVARTDALADAGALVVDRVSAMLGILEEAVVSPRAAELVLHTDPDRETVQVTVRAARVVGRELRSLRLPPDVLVLAVDRDGQTITPDGLTRLRRGDELTLIGPPEGIAETTVRLQA